MLSFNKKIKKLSALTALVVLIIIILPWSALAQNPTTPGATGGTKPPNTNTDNPKTGYPVVPGTSLNNTPKATDNAGTEATTGKNPVVQEDNVNTVKKTEDESTNAPYKLLEPFGDELQNFDASTDRCAFGKYLNTMMKIFLGLCAVMAMVMIVLGGVQYMTSELLSSKEEGAKNIQGAVFGFILALAAYAILNTLNPALLNLCPHIPEAKIKIDPGEESVESFKPLTKSDLEKIGVYCPGSGGKDELAKIANSFQGKVIYDTKNGRNTISGSKVRLDCSAFVKQVWNCAGLDFNGERTAEMFKGQNNITIVNNKINGTTDLQVGDLLGWMSGEDPKFGPGHVVMYIGNGKFVEVNGSGWNIGNLNHYGKLIHIIKAY